MLSQLRQLALRDDATVTANAKKSLSLQDWPTYMYPLLVGARALLLEDSISSASCKKAYLQVASFEFWARLVELALAQP